jgi:hypothetical protein
MPISVQLRVGEICNFVNKAVVDNDYSTIVAKVVAAVDEAKAQKKTVTFRF